MTAVTGFLFCAGAASILYYVGMLLYTKRWTTTFSWFFAVFGIGNFLMAWMIPKCSVWLRDTVLILYAIFWIAVLWGMFLIIKAMNAKALDGIEWLIVLGAQVRGRKITDSLKRRLDRAVEYLCMNPKTKVIVSGGQGKGEFVTEAYAMAEYLKEKGISHDRIFLEDQSETTNQNLNFSAVIIGDQSKTTGIVTNNFHVCRALMLAERLGYSRVYGISASSNPVVLVNYMVREVFAVFQFLMKKER